MTIQPEAFVILVHIGLLLVYAIFILFRISYLRTEHIIPLCLIPIFGPILALVIEFMNLTRKQGTGKPGLETLGLDDGILWTTLTNVQEKGDLVPLEEAVLINEVKIRRRSMNSKIQILTLDGSYIKQLIMLEGIYSLVTIKNQLYLQILEQYGKKRNGPAIFARYSLNGELLSFFGEIGKSEYNTFYNDNSQTIRAFNGELHCLQLYGPTYRIYNPMGEPVREIKLEVNPLHNKEYKKTGWLYTYRSFAVDEHRICATHAGKGKIIINVFNREGKYLFTYYIKQETDDISEVSDMKIVLRKDRKLLLLLVHYPDTKFILAELDE